MKKECSVKRKHRILSILLIAAVMSFSLMTYAAVMHEKAYAASASDIKPGDHITMGTASAQGYDGTPYWRVLDKEKDGSLLLMSEYLWTGDGENNASAEVKFDPANKSNRWKGSNAQKWCSEFADAVLSDIPGATVIETTKSDDEYLYEFGRYTEYIFGSSENILDNDKVFFLSAEEVVRYMPEPESRLAYINGSAETGLWLLRSPLKSDRTGSGYTNRVGEILKGTGTSGAMNAVSSWTGTPARPAFYAAISPDACLSGTENDGSVDWVIKAEQHELGTPEYSWSDDSSKCTASAQCSICGDRITETVDAVSETIEEPTADKEGFRCLTASFSNAVFETQTKTDAIPKVAPSDSSNADGKKGQIQSANELTPAPVTINTKVVNAAVVKKAVDAAAKQGLAPDTIIIGKKVRKIGKSAFKGTQVKTLIIKSKKLSKKSVKGSLRGSAVKNVKVKIGKKSINKKYVKKYKKIFTRKNAGRKTRVR